MNNIDRLEDIVSEVICGNLEQTAVLSTGELYYVALASNHIELLNGVSIACALVRLGNANVNKLIELHEHDSVKHLMPTFN